MYVRQTFHNSLLILGFNLTPVKEKSTPSPEILPTAAEHNSKSSHGQLADDVDTYALSTSPPKSTVSKQVASQNQLKGSKVVDSYGGGAELQNVSKETTELELDSRTPSQQTHSHLQKLQREAYSQLQSKIDYMSTNSSNPIAGAYDAGSY